MTEYTDELRKAVAERVRSGEMPSQIAKDIGVTPRTVNKWAAKFDVSSQERAEKTAEARHVLQEHQKRQREKLRLLLLDKAVDLLERMDEPHKDFKGSHVQEVWWDSAPASATKDYATAAAILIDKYRLEMGEATGRFENIDLQSAISRVDQEIEKLASQLNDDA